MQLHTMCQATVEDMNDDWIRAVSRRCATCDNLFFGCLWLFELAVGSLTQEYSRLISLYSSGCPQPPPGDAE